MRKQACYLVLLCAVLATPSFAGSQTGQISYVYRRASDGLAYFIMSGTSSGRAACAANTAYWMIKDETSNAGKGQIAMLLTAHATGQAISVTGAGTCTRWGDGEDVDTIAF